MVIYIILEYHRLYLKRSRPKKYPFPTTLQVKLRTKVSVTYIRLWFCLPFGFLMMHLISKMLINYLQSYYVFFPIRVLLAIMIDTTIFSVGFSINRRESVHPAPYIGQIKAVRASGWRTARAGVPINPLKAHGAGAGSSPTCVLNLVLNWGCSLDAACVDSRYRC